VYSICQRNRLHCAGTASAVTITASTTGAAGNNITLTSTLTNFTAWSSTHLAGGVNPQASILAFNNLYSGASSTANGAGTFTLNTVTGSQNATITNPAMGSPLVLTPSDPVAASRTGTFSARPPNNTSTITAGNITLKTNATTENATGTFSAGYCAQNGQGSRSMAGAV